MHAQAPSGSSVPFEPHTVRSPPRGSASAAMQRNSGLTYAAALAAASSASEGASMSGAAVAAGSGSSAQSRGRRTAASTAHGFDSGTMPAAGSSDSRSGAGHRNGGIGPVATETASVDALLAHVRALAAAQAAAEKEEAQVLQQRVTSPQAHAATTSPSSFQAGASGSAWVSRGPASPVRAQAAALNSSSAALRVAAASLQESLRHRSLSPQGGAPNAVGTFSGGTAVSTGTNNGSIADAGERTRLSAAVALARTLAVAASASPPFGTSPTSAAAAAATIASSAAFDDAGTRGSVTAGAARFLGPPGGPADDDTGSSSLSGAAAASSPAAAGFAESPTVSATRTIPVESGTIGREASLPLLPASQPPSRASSASRPVSTADDEPASASPILSSAPAFAAAPAPVAARAFRSALLHTALAKPGPATTSASAAKRV